MGRGQAAAQLKTPPGSERQNWSKMKVGEAGWILQPIAPIALPPEPGHDQRPPRNRRRARHPR